MANSLIGLWGGFKGKNMNPNLLVALKESISYWENIVALKDYPRGMKGCALCIEIFNNSTEYNGCESCPVFDITNEYLCRDTPYIEVVDFLKLCKEGRSLSHLQIIERMTSEQKEEYVNLCQKELDFLRSLLP